MKGLLSLMVILPTMSFAHEPVCEPVTSRDILPVAAREHFDQGGYVPCKVTLEGTNFFILGRASGGLGSERIVKSLRASWPKFYGQFQFVLPDATIVDAEGALGGGPLGNFVVGIYSSQSISVEESAYIEQATGWPAQASTDEYIGRHYISFEDPYQAYVDDMVIHELGHFLFGFGITRVKSFSYEDAWFALGMGIVYDRLVWSDLKSSASPLFKSVADVWLDRFSGRHDVDQRLVNPDVSKDEELGLIRLQTYGHGKAWLYLQALRDAIGERDFDRLVSEYLTRPIGSGILYDDFLAEFPESFKSTLDELETKFLVR